MILSYRIHDPPVLRYNSHTNPSRTLNLKTSKDFLDHLVIIFNVSNRIIIPNWWVYQWDIKKCSYHFLVTQNFPHCHYLSFARVLQIPLTKCISKKYQTWVWRTKITHKPHLFGTKYVPSRELRYLTYWKRWESSTYPAGKKDPFKELHLKTGGKILQKSRKPTPKIREANPKTSHFIMEVPIDEFPGKYGIPWVLFGWFLG